MTRFTSHQIDMFLAEPAPAGKESALTEEQKHRNEEAIIQRIHSHNSHRRSAWMAAAASVALLFVVGVTVHLLPGRFSANTADDTLHALYDTDNVPTEHIEEQEIMVECDYFLEYVS